MKVKHRPQSQAFQPEALVRHCFHSSDEDADPAAPAAAKAQNQVSGTASALVRIVLFLTEEF